MQSAPLCLNLPAEGKNLFDQVFCPVSRQDDLVEIACSHRPGGTILPGHFRIASRWIVAAPFRLDAERGHDTQVGIEARQEPPHIPQLVALPGAALAAGVGPDLEKIVMLLQIKPQKKELVKLLQIFVIVQEEKIFH